MKLKKSLGQHILVKKSVLAKIIDTADIAPDDTILEIGAGTGILTKELLKKAKKVVAVEIDTELIKSLKQLFKAEIESGKLRLIKGDILNISEKELALPDGYKIVANIPYYITSKILERFLTLKKLSQVMVLLVQKEVGERICAKPGCTSILSISVQYFAKPEIVAKVPAAAFRPMPAVDSTVIKISDIKNRASKEVNQKDFFRLVKVSFASRRKTLANNLSAGFYISKEEAFDIIKKANLQKTVRAQELTVADWILITKLGRKWIKNHQSKL